jgi:hypothetical protein
MIAQLGAMSDKELIELVEGRLRPGFDREISWLVSRNDVFQGASAGSGGVEPATISRIHRQSVAKIIRWQGAVRLLVSQS